MTVQVAQVTPEPPLDPLAGTAAPGTLGADDAELKAAEARAAVHRAEQDVAAHRTTIDQHRRNIKEKLGVDMSNLMGG